MRWYHIVKTQITIIASILLCACSPASKPGDLELSSIPDTVTPIPTEIVNDVSDNVVPLRTLSGHNGRVLDVVFSAQGEFLASSSQDMNIKLWEVSSGEEIHTFRMSSVDMADIDISLVRNLLASGEAIWDLESLEEIHILERGLPVPGFVVFSPDGSMLALGLFEQQITLWDVISGQPVYTFDRQAENRTKKMDFSPDGTLLAVGVNDGTVRLIDIESGHVSTVLKYSGETDIHDLVFSPDGKYLATGGRVPLVILWDLSSEEVLKTFRLTDNVISMDFSPDGRLLATAGGYQYEVRLWDVESGNLLHSMPHNDQITSVAFAPDGKMLAVGCFDGNIYLWDIPLDQ